MATAVIAFPGRELDEDLRQQALESDRCIRQAWVKVSKRSMEIGWEAAWLKRKNAWYLLGYENEYHYRASVGVCRTTWFDMIKIAERFPDLDKKTYLAMTIENARRLALEPEEVRYNPEMLAKAATEKARDFKDELTTAGAHREGKPLSEHWVTMEWRIREEQREVIESGLQDWQKEHGIDDPGYALELMIAEYRERPTLVGFMTESIPRLTQQILAAQTEEELKDLRNAFAAHVREMDEVLKICCGEARVA